MLTQTESTRLNELWTNWMFRLSLSSNELFHSNFLQVLFSQVPEQPGNELELAAIDEGDEEAATGPEASPSTENGDDKNLTMRVSRDLATTFFACMGIAKEAAPDINYEIRREWMDLDLCLIARSIGDGQPHSAVEKVVCAVELKIKSIPDTNQLLRYRKKIADFNKGAPFTLVLLSLMDPAEEVGRMFTAQHFIHLSFDQLGAVLENHQARWNDKSVAAPLDEYIRLCKGLSLLKQTWTESCLSAPANFTLEQLLERESAYRPYRLNALWSKLCASKLCLLVHEEMTKRLVPTQHAAGQVLRLSNGGLRPMPNAEATHSETHADWTFESSAGFSRSGWNANFFWIKRDADSDDRVAVGVQIEGATFRFTLSVKNGCLPTQAQDARKKVEDILLTAANDPAIRLFGAVHHAWENQGALNAHLPALAFFALNGKYDFRQPAKTKTNTFRLPGYANGRKSGHADFRLTIPNCQSLQTIAEQVATALLGGFDGLPEAASSCTGSPQEQVKQVFLRLEAVYARLVHPTPPGMADTRPTGASANPAAQ